MPDIPVLLVPAGSELRSTAYLTAGWLSLTEALFEELDALAPGWTLFDVGQKFKWLHVTPRLPADTSPDTVHAVRAALEEARLRSLALCDFCGATVEPREGGTRTRCDVHRSTATYTDADAPVRLLVRSTQVRLVKPYDPPAPSPRSVGRHREGADG